MPIPVPTGDPTPLPSIDCPSGSVRIRTGYYPDGASWAGITNSVYDTDSGQLLSSTSGTRPDVLYECRDEDAGCVRSEFTSTTAFASDLAWVIGTPTESVLTTFDQFTYSNGKYTSNYYFCIFDGTLARNPTSLPTESPQPTPRPTGAPAPAPTPRPSHQPTPQPTPRPTPQPTPALIQC